MPVSGYAPYLGQTEVAVPFFEGHSWTKREARRNDDPITVLDAVQQARFVFWKHAPEPGVPGLGRVMAGRNFDLLKIPDVSVLWIRLADRKLQDPLVAKKIG